MGSETLHERFDDLTPYTRDMHRAIVSLMEELEAIDWYQQRIDATPDAALSAVLAHNRDEEIEHAMMNLEWVRRNNSTFATAAKLYLFTEGPITEIEEKSKEKEKDGDDGAPAAAVTRDAAAGSTTPSSGNDGSLGIGSLKLA